MNEWWKMEKKLFVPKVYYTIQCMEKSWKSHSVIHFPLPYKLSRQMTYRDEYIEIIWEYPFWEEKKSWWAAGKFYWKFEKFWKISQLNFFFWNLHEKLGDLIAEIFAFHAIKLHIRVGFILLFWKFLKLQFTYLKICIQVCQK